MLYSIGMNKKDKKPVVLYVEDEKLLAEMYQFKFNHEGFDCYIAEDGNQGLKMAKEIHPDIILSDILMPQEDGISMLTKLRSDEAMKDIPVILLTNLSDQNNVDKAIELGAHSFLVKSQTTPAKVIELVTKILQNEGKL